MHHALTRKLSGFVDLSFDEQAAVGALIPRIREVDARVDLTREGDVPEDVHLILDGFACRYKMLPNGQRQIMAYLIPGDFCDLNVFILDEMDHNIGTIAPCKVAAIPRSAIDKITSQYPNVTRAFWWCALVDEAVLREWLVNIGGRPPEQRIAHLMCELLLRLEAVGKVQDNSFVFPLTQAEIADTMGLSSIHVNRTLRHLRELGLISLKQRVLRILDVDQLKALSGFNANYLHLKNTRWGDRRSEAWLNQAQGL